MTPEPTPTATPCIQGTYIVQEGDTLYDIAQRFEVSVDELMGANEITDPANLSVGQKLVIPGQEPGRVPEGTPSPEAGATTATPTAAGVYIVREGDYPNSIAEQFGITVEDLMEANGITDPTSLTVGQVLVIPCSTRSPTATASPTLTDSPTPLRNVCPLNPDPSGPDIMVVEEPRENDVLSSPAQVRGWGAGIGFEDAGAQAS